MGWDNVYGERFPKEKILDIIHGHIAKMQMDMSRLMREHTIQAVREIHEQGLTENIYDIIK